MADALGTREVDRIEVDRDELGNWRVSVYSGTDLVRAGGAGRWQEALAMTAGGRSNV
jgi:hypothetical protein